MKNKIYALVYFIATSLTSINAQTGNINARLTATISQTSPNSVMVAFKPNITFSGQFSNLQFTFQIPSSVTPQPTVSIKSNPLSAYVPTGGYTMVTTLEPGYVTYSYNVLVTGAPVFSFAAGTSYNALEVSFNNNSSATTEVRLAHLANGGTTLQEAFYVEINGNDNTEYLSMFYGSGTVNGGSASTYSYAPLASVVLPVKFTAFSVVRKDVNAVLNWTVENETSTVDHYEIERSINGTRFDKISILPKANNGNNGNIYTYIDLNFGNTQNNGLIYYRIKQIDVDSRFVYSEIKALRVADKIPLMSVYPNPAKQTTTLQIQAPDAMDVTFTLLNAGGRAMQTNTLHAVKGINLKQISMSNYPAGSYLLKITIGTDSQTLKIIKE